MNRTIEELLHDAKLWKELRGDEKSYCHLNELMTLLKHGAYVKLLNREQMSGTYITTVVYKGHNFITVTSNPLQFEMIPKFLG